mgnify:CR=1 FL=1
MPGPIEGKLVLDLTHVLAGPFAGMVLSDLGATVIKVEKPEVGDRVLVKKVWDTSLKPLGGLTGIITPCGIL